MLELLNIIFDGTYVSFDCKSYYLANTGIFKVKFNLEKEELIPNPKIDEMMISQNEKDLLKQFSRKAMNKLIAVYEEDHAFPSHFFISLVLTKRSKIKYDVLDVIDMSNILFDGKYVALDCRYPKLPKLRNFKVMFNLKEEKLLGIVDESKYDSFEVFWIKFLSLQAMWIISDYYREEHKFPSNKVFRRHLYR